MNSSRLFNVSGISLLMRFGGGCHLLQNLTMLEIHFPTSFVALAGDTGPQIRGTRFDQNWKLILGRFLFGGGGCSSDRTRGFLVPGTRCWVKIQSCFRAMAHTPGYLCAVTGIISRYLTSIWSFSPIKVSMNSIILFKKTPFLFQNCILLLAETEPCWYMSYVTWLRLQIHEGPVWIEYFCYCSSSHTAWHTLWFSAYWMISLDLSFPFNKLDKM